MAFVHTHSHVVCECERVSNAYGTNISFNSLPTDVAANNILRWIILIFSFHFSRFSTHGEYARTHNQIQSERCVACGVCIIFILGANVPLCGPWRSKTRGFISRRDKILFILRKEITKYFMVYSFRLCKRTNGWTKERKRHVRTTHNAHVWFGWRAFPIRSFAHSFTCIRVNFVVSV